MSLSVARLATRARRVGQRECRGQFRTPGFKLSPVVSHTTRVHDGPAGKGAGDEPDELQKAQAEDRKPVKNITLLIPLDDTDDIDDTDDTKQPRFQAKHMGMVTRGHIMKMLDRRGCDLVEHPDSGELVELSMLELHDNMTIITDKPEQTGIKKRVEGLEGFQRSAVTSHEQEATEALANRFREEYGGNVVVVPISKVKSTSGRTREIDGVVVAENVVGIMEAKTKVSAKQDIEQVKSVLEFIQTEPLVGLAGHMFRGKELRGFLAYKVTPSSQEAIAAMRKACADHHIGLIVTSGKGMTARGNSAVGEESVDLA